MNDGLLALAVVDRPNLEGRILGKCQECTIFANLSISFRLFQIPTNVPRPMSGEFPSCTLLRELTCQC